jgi:Fur family ferric uptake transcriptional regulator/Fur family peroxide stress response transcriptional regulator
MANNFVYETLLRHQIKPSVQRMAIMTYLMDHRTHPSVDEIYVALSPEYPTLSRTTVYNTLKLFKESGAIEILTIDDRMTCYDADVTPHAHLLCKSCNRIFDLPMPPTLMSEMADVKGCRIDETHLYYRGLCPECLKEEQQAQA